MKVGKLAFAITGSLPATKKKLK